MNNSLILANAHRLPVLDWNICFFGGHTQTVEKGWHVPDESHLAFELIFIIDGKQKTIIEQNTYYMNKEDMLIIPPGFIHNITCGNENGMKYFCAHFDIDDPTFIMNMTQKSKIYYKSGSKENLILKQHVLKFIDLIDYNMNYNFLEKMKVQIILSNFLLELDQLLITNAISNKKSIQESKYAKIISEKIKATLKEKILFSADTKTNAISAKEIKIENIVNEIGLSAGYGYSVFKNVYGLSPRKYLSNLMLKEAELMLTNPQLSIEDISERLGYKNLAHFSRQFKRWKGISPNNYRKIIT